MSSKQLGKLIAVHPVTARHMQRAVFIAVLAFLFFLAMMFAFYVRQNILYFLLSTAFLIVYLLTMFSLIMQRRNVVQVFFENGILIKKTSAPWNEIVEVRDDGTIVLKNTKTIKISTSVNDYELLIKLIRSRTSR